MFRFSLAPPLLFNPLQFLFSTNTRFLKPLALLFSPTTRLCFLPPSGLLCCQPTTLLLLSSQPRFFRSLATSGLFEGKDTSLGFPDAFELFCLRLA